MIKNVEGRVTENEKKNKELYQNLRLVDEAAKQQAVLAARARIKSLRAN